MWSLNIFLLVGASFLGLSYAVPAPDREGDNEQAGVRRIFWWNNNLPKENADVMNSWDTLIGKCDVYIYNNISVTCFDT